MTGHPEVSGFELNQLGLSIEVVPTLIDATGLGTWIAEQSADVHAEILIGLLVETEPAPADVMLHTVRIGRELRARRIDPAWITPALEHLLRALRGQTDPTNEGDDDAQPDE